MCYQRIAPSTTLGVVNVDDDNPGIHRPFAHGDQGLRIGRGDHNRTHALGDHLLDEFHLLGSYKIKDPFLCFAKEIMTQKDTMYIVSSSEVASIKKILSEKLALLFGNFEKITLGGFDCETSDAFLKKKLASIKINDELLDFIIAFADGHPFYLDVLSGKINELMGNLRFRMATTPMLSQALEELLFDSRGTLNQFFINLDKTKFLKPYMLRILNGDTCFPSLNNFAL